MAAFAGTTYNDLLDWFSGSALENQLKSKYEAKGWDWGARGARPDYERNEAGRYVNESGEELYYWTGPDYDTEYKNKAGLNADADYMTMADIKAAYEEDKLLKQAFESWDQYKAYIVERQDLIDQGVIMDKWERDAQLWNENGGLPGRGPKSDALNAILVEERDRRNNAAYEAQFALNEKYGLSRDIVDDNGNELVWNGTGYSLVDRYEVDKGKIATGLGLGIIGGGLVGPAIAGKLGGGMLGNAVGAGITNAGTQLALTGDIDPRGVLAAGVVGGLNPGEKLAGVLGDSIGMSGVDQPFNPDSFGYGAISGAGNSAVSQLITDGSLDAGGLLQAGLISGGLNSVRDALNDADYYTQEKIAERLVAQGYTPEEAWAMAGNDPNLFRGKSDLGALVGEGGLLPFIPEVSVGGLGRLADVLAGGSSTFYRYPDGTEIPASLMTDASITRAYEAGADEVVQNSIGLLNNPVVNAAGSVLGQILGSPTMSDEDRAIYDGYRETAEINAELDPNWGNLSAVGQEALITEIQQDLYRGYLASYHGSDGLDEKYTVAPNPRGDAEIIGSALIGIDPETGDPLYTTGISYQDQLADGTFIDTALNIPKPPEAPNNNVIINFGNSDQGILPAANTNQDVLNYILTDSILNGTFVNDDTSNSGASDANTGSNQTNQSNDVVTGSQTNQNNNAVAGSNGSTLSSGSSDSVVTTPASETTPVYGLEINDNGTATLPGGATVPAAVADSIFEQTYLPSDYELGSASSATLPAGGGGGGGGGGSGSSNQGGGLPPLWSELFGYTRITPYEKARLKVMDNIFSGLQGDGMMSPKIVSSPYMKINRDLIDAGIMG